jgi:hypothetical protein
MPFKRREGHPDDQLGMESLMAAQGQAGEPAFLALCVQEMARRGFANDRINYIQRLRILLRGSRDGLWVKMVPASNGGCQTELCDSPSGDHKQPPGFVG